MLGGNIAGFARVGVEVVEFDRAARIAGDVEAYGFPWSFEDGLLFALLVEFPIEMIVLRLPAFF